MRRRGRIDANQVEIVRILRSLGCTVQSLADVGKGCPDLSVGYRGKNHLVEVKDGSRPPSGQRLSDDERLWHLGWKGEAVVILRSAAEAVCWLNSLNPEDSNAV